MAAIATFGIAVGLAVVMMAVIDRVLVRPLPFAAADRLVALWESAPREGLPKARVAAASFASWREGARSFDRMALFGSARYTATGSGEAFPVEGARVLGDYFTLLGIAPAAGRVFTAAEMSGQSPPPPVVIVSHALATSRFGDPAGAVGRTLRLDDAPRTIVGVMPAQVIPARATHAGVLELVAGRDFVWVPLTQPAFRNSHVFGVLARLRPGVTVEQAQAELSSLARHDDADRDARVVPLVEEAVGAVERALWIAGAAVGLVLLIAAANVGGLLLVRASARAREFAVRRAIGASGLHLFRQLALESIALAGLGTVAGLLVAVPSLRLLPRLLPGDVPRLAEAAVDLRVIAFTALLAVVCGLAVAVVPLLQMRRMASLSQRGTAADGRLRSLLVVAETAVAVVLVAGAGLLVRTLGELGRVDPGFSPANVLVAKISHTQRFDTQEKLTGYYDRLFERLRGLPDVVSVAAAYDPPLGLSWTQSFTLAGEAATADHSAAFRTVTPGYFETTGVALLAGRGFTEQDDARHGGAMVVNQAFAARFLGGRVLGRRVGVQTTQWQWGEDAVPGEFTVVGVVEDERFDGVEAPAAPAFYLPYRQTPHSMMTLLVRTRHEPAALASALRAVARGVDADVPLAGVTTLRDLLADSLARPRFSAQLLGLFGLVAVLLTTLGTAALIAQTLRQRQRELAVRIALGAAPARAMRWAIGHGLAPAASGVALGVPLALAVTRAMRHLLFGVTPGDPLVYSSAVALLLLGALVACAPAALRAVRLGATSLLREE